MIDGLMNGWHKVYIFADNFQESWATVAYLSYIYTDWLTFTMPKDIDCVNRLSWTWESQAYDQPLSPCLSLTLKVCKTNHHHHKYGTRLNSREKSLSTERDFYIV